MTKNGKNKPQTKKINKHTISDSEIKQIADDLKTGSGIALKDLAARTTLPRSALYAIIRNLAPDLPASRVSAAVGYNTTTTKLERTKTYQEYARDVRQKRIDLANRPGLRLEDSAMFYKDMSKDFENVEPKVRLQARQALDNVLGHNAPKELAQTVDVGENGIPAFMQLIQGMGLTPAQLKAQLAVPTDMQIIDG